MSVFHLDYIQYFCGSILLRDRVTVDQFVAVGWLWCMFIYDSWTVSGMLIRYFSQFRWYTWLILAFWATSVCQCDFTERLQACRYHSAAASQPCLTHQWVDQYQLMLCGQMFFKHLILNSNQDSKLSKDTKHVRLYYTKICIKWFTRPYHDRLFSFEKHGVFGFDILFIARFI